MLPYAKDPPTSTAKFAIHTAVTFAVTRTLGVPEFAVGFWASVTAGATVPEAAVNEEGEAVGAEKEVGLSENRLLATPAGNVICL